MEATWWVRSTLSSAITTTRASATPASSAITRRVMSPGTTRRPASDGDPTHVGIEGRDDIRAGRRTRAPTRADEPARRSRPGHNVIVELRVRMHRRVGVEHLPRRGVGRARAERSTTSARRIPNGLSTIKNTVTAMKASARTLSMPIGDQARRPPPPARSTNENSPTWASTSAEPKTTDFGVDPGSRRRQAPSSAP